MKAQTLYIATSNPGKLRDFAAAQIPASILLLPLPGLERTTPPIENADTFHGNALLKATAYSLLAPDHIVLADDSGLEVDALDGSPGVFSARFAEQAAFPNACEFSTDALNNAYLLRRLEGVKDERRAARYRCVLAAARNGTPLHRDGKVIFGEGTVEGIILAEARGADGFGYDPLFFLPSRSKTMAEIPIEEKLTFSHRGRALTHLLHQLI